MHNNDNDNESCPRRTWSGSTPGIAIDEVSSLVNCSVNRSMGQAII
jgi:hypothetical protein